MPVIRAVLVAPDSVMSTVVESIPAMTRVGSVAELSERASAVVLLSVECVD